MRSTTELREEILAAARAEFAQYGLAGARIDRIARGANASKERLYAHFRDKDNLFRVLAERDAAEFFNAVPVQPDAVAEFAGAVYDLSIRWPEHVRMTTWARLEQVNLLEPHHSGESVIAKSTSAVEAAQAQGYVDTFWKPFDLLTMLFGIGLAWAHSPNPEAITDDPVVIGQRRAAAVEAAARLIAPRP